jgi:hypothetical protein
VVASSYKEYHMYSSFEEIEELDVQLLATEDVEVEDAELDVQLLAIEDIEDTENTEYVEYVEDVEDVEWDSNSPLEELKCVDEELAMPVPLPMTMPITMPVSMPAYQPTPWVYQPTPRKKRDYANGKIYVIESVEGKTCYIGSTCKSLRERMHSHKKGMWLWEEGRGGFITSYYVLRYSDARICLVENCPCESELELLTRESFHILNARKCDVGCMNKVVPIPEKKEKRIRSSPAQPRRPPQPKGGRCDVCDCSVVYMSRHITTAGHIGRLVIDPVTTRDARQCLRRQGSTSEESASLYLPEMERDLDDVMYAYPYATSSDESDAELVPPPSASEYDGLSVDEMWTKMCGVDCDPYLITDAEEMREFEKNYAFYFPGNVAEPCGAEKEDDLFTVIDEVAMLEFEKNYALYFPGDAAEPCGAEKEDDLYLVSDAAEPCGAEKEDDIYLVSGDVGAENMAVGM